MSSPNTGTVPPETPQSHSPLAARRGHNLNLNTFASVDQSGTYPFQRVLKSGEVLKRRKRTRSWKPVELVLRPNVLSIYKDHEATQLRHQIFMHEITAVAQRKDTKRKGEHEGVFGIFSPARNFHLEAPSADVAKQWVALIRQEAQLDEEDEDLLVTSPGGAERNYSGFGRFSSPAHDGSSSGDLHAVPTVPVRSRGSSSLDYSGNERASNSDFVDTPISGSFRENYLQTHPGLHGFSPLPTNPLRPPWTAGSGRIRGNGSQVSVAEVAAKEERVVCHGYLLCLKSKSGVRRWIKYWVVLRPKYFTLYKTDQEYEASLILPVSDIVDAVDIDPVSKNKQFCMQVITESKTYRFCANDEEELTRWLGSVKSVLARRREAASNRQISSSSGPAR